MPSEDKRGQNRKIACSRQWCQDTVRTGQHCLPHGQRPGSSPSEDSNVPQRRFKIQRRQMTPSEGSSMGETSFHKFNGRRAARKQRAQAIDYINNLLLSVPQDVSPRLESLILILIPPPITSSSCGEGSSSSGVPLDSIPQDLASHHKFVSKWLTKLSELTVGEALQYGIRWEKVPGKEDLHEWIAPVSDRCLNQLCCLLNGSDLV